MNMNDKQEESAALEKKLLEVIIAHGDAWEAKGLSSHDITSLIMATTSMLVGQVLAMAIAGHNKSHEALDTGLELMSRSAKTIAVYRLNEIEQEESAARH